MVLTREIELELCQKDKHMPEAIEDSLIKDSVLDLANTDFSKFDDFEEVTPGEIRKKILIDSGYSGKPISRKHYSTNNLKGDVFARKKTSSEEDEDDTELSNDDNSDVGSLQGNEHVEFSGDESEKSTDVSGRASEIDEDVQSDDEDKEEEFDDENSVEDVDDEDFGDDIDIGQHQNEENVTQNLDINIFSEKTKDINTEVAKGRSVKNQLNIWETLVEGRIKLQPSLVSVNKLYQKEDFNDFKAKLTSADETVLTNTYRSLGRLMQILLELQETMLHSSPEYLNSREKGNENCENNDEDSDNESISSSLASGKEIDEDSDSNDEGDDESKTPSKVHSSLNEPVYKKRKLDNYNDHLDELYKDFKHFKDGTIQMWYDKTRITSGKAIKSSDTYDQSTLKQIEQILLDKNRLIKKTQLKRSDYSILGKEEMAVNGNHEAERNENAQTEDRGLKEYDTEIFDDDDFYHKLLRDFIERKSTDVTDTRKHGRQWLEIQHLRSKMKRKVDTRCTKGRKLRYTVHNKLVNFMAPIPCNLWTEDAQTELFKSLFGKTSNSNMER